VLDLGDQGGALRLSGDRGERLGLFPGLLHHIEIQLQRGTRIQAKQLMLTEQVAVRSRRGVGVGEQAAQQGNSVAQVLTRIGGLTVGPQQRRQLAARMQAPLHHQVEQQGLRLAQGKAEAAAVMHHFRWAEHGQA
jgi:hypothetical protein